MQLGVVNAEAHNGFHFLLHELLDFAVVVAFVLASKNQHGGLGHAFEGIPGAVYVGGFRVVDVSHAAHGVDVFQAVLNRLEVGKRLAYGIFLDVENRCRQGGCH